MQLGDLLKDATLICARSPVCVVNGPSVIYQYTATVPRIVYRCACVKLLCTSCMAQSGKGPNLLGMESRQVLFDELLTFQF